MSFIQIGRKFAISEAIISDFASIVPLILFALCTFRHIEFKFSTFEIDFIDQIRMLMDWLDRAHDTLAMEQKWLFPHLKHVYFVYI